MKVKLKLTAVLQEAEEEGYTAFIEELPGVNTQGDTLDEAKANLLEAMDLVMDTRCMLSEEDLKNTRFIKESLDLAS